MVDLILRNGRLADGTAGIDFAIAGGFIVEAGPGLMIQAKQTIDLEGKLVIPGFVEPHLHLDIALMNSGERPGRPEPYLSHTGLNEAVERRRKSFTSEDIQRRAGQALELASRHGVTALRAQCHVDLEIGLRHLEALLAVKGAYRDRIDLQIVTFPQQGLLQHAGTMDLFREAFRLGADVMGCASNLDRGIRFEDHIDAALALALEFEVDFDIHADLGIPDQVALADLEIVYTAKRVIEEGYQGRVAAGHVCALGSAEPADASHAIEIIKAADISVISQPDMYRLGRDDRMHVRRGLTRVKELLAAGVNVTLASNNVRDALRPLGNFNLLEEALVLAYGAHMDTVEELETLLEMCTYKAARALRLDRYGLEVGCKADLVVLDAPTPSAAIVNQAEKLYVFKAGRMVAKNKIITEVL